jgi:predicted Zn-dependent peptidase
VKALAFVMLACAPAVAAEEMFQPPPIVSSTKVDLGALERFKLPNGLDVIVVPRRNVPAVDVTLAIRAGNGENPVQQSGLAQFTASMLRKGTKKRSADQIADEIDFVGGDLDTGSDDDGSYISCRARSKDLTLCLDLVADVSQRPTFPEAEMGEIRDQLMASVESAKDSPQSLAAEHGANLFFGDDDPRGRPVSKRSIEAIDRSSLLKHYQRWYAPNNALMAISGDVDPKAVKKELTKWFGGWKKQKIVASKPRELPKNGKLRVRLVDKPDATQSAIVLVGAGIKHADPDYPAMRLMNFALGGGGFSSRLMKVVRSEGGKTYGARSHFDARRDEGVFTASTFTRTSETAATLALVQGEIERMRTGGPNDEELRAAKGNLIGGFGLHLETGADVARLLLGLEIDGLPATFATQYPSKLDAVTLDDAKRVAARLLKPMALVIVGNATEVKPLLAKIGVVADEVVPYTEPVSAAERTLAKAAPAVEVAPEEEAAGKRLLQTALAAKGAALLAKVKDLKMTGKGTMTIKGQPLPITVEESYLPGKAARQDIILAAGRVEQVWADGRGFVREAGRTMDMPADAIESVKRGLFRDPNFILLNATRPGAHVRSVGADLEVISPDGDRVTVRLDPKTHLISALEYKEEGKAVRDLLGDYRTVGGIAFAHHFVHTGEPQSVEITYEQVLLDKGLPAAIFQK